MKKIVFVILLLCTFAACNKYGKYRKTISILDHLLGDSITFHHKNIYYINSQDTVIEDKNEYEYLIVVCTHPSDCEVCEWKLDEWFLKRKEILMYNENVDFKFVIQSRNYDEAGHYIIHAMPDIPVIYDSTGVFIKQNNLPEEQRYHTFLLDKNKKILLVGSPIGNDKLWDMYKEIIKNKEI
jgi:hypothetical protein